MRRAYRIYLNDLNPTKAAQVKEFLVACHDATQYFVDLLWQRGDFSADLADLETVHRGRARFGLTTRLAQALAKQAKEAVRSARAKGRRKPRLHRLTTTLYYHFVSITPFRGNHFDYAVELGGSGAPRVLLPVHATRPLNARLRDGWRMARTVRLGWDKGRVWADIMVEKPRPPQKEQGVVVGMDSNYKNGLVFSDGQQVGQDVVQRIRSFSKRQKHTHAEVKSLMGHALKQVDFSRMKALCIENLKYVKHGKRGTFPRTLNRRLSHWLYAYLMELLGRHCEEHGVRLERKDPWKTSQFCRACRRWDRRSRAGDRFRCVHCGYSAHADLNAATNLALLGEAGVYGLRWLPSLKVCSV
jgi:IS605 OrfB family transposase